MRESFTKHAFDKIRARIFRLTAALCAETLEEIFSISAHRVELNLDFLAAAL